jgi:hypothetical protein
VKPELTILQEPEVSANVGIMAGVSDPVSPITVLSSLMPSAQRSAAEYNVTGEPGTPTFVRFQPLA